MKIYIEAKSKKQINKKLLNNKKVIGLEYNAFNPKGFITEHTLNDCEDGTLIAIYTSYSGSNPIATDWFIWDKKKNLIK